MISSSKLDPLFTRAMTGPRSARPRAPTADLVADPASRLDEALRLMHQGRWRPAFDRLAELADVGQPQAARIALLFVWRGTSLFGGNFHASAVQRECWRRAGA